MVLYPSLEGMYGLQLNKTLAGHVTPEQAMEEAQVQFETILKQNFYHPYPMEGYNDTLEKAVELIEALSP